MCRGILPGVTDHALASRDHTVAPLDHDEPPAVPREWAARGFSGRYYRTVHVPADLTAQWAANAPCLLRDQAWLLLEVRNMPADIPGVVDPNAPCVATLVRLDAAALVDLTAASTGRAPSPGAYQ